MAANAMATTTQTLALLLLLNFHTAATTATQTPLLQALKLLHCCRPLLVQTGRKEDVPEGHWDMVVSRMALSAEQRCDLVLAYELFQVRRMEREGEPGRMVESSVVCAAALRPGACLPMRYSRCGSGRRGERMGARRRAVLVAERACHLHLHACLLHTAGAPGMAKGVC